MLPDPSYERLEPPLEAFYDSTATRPGITESSDVLVCSTTGIEVTGIRGLEKVDDISDPPSAEGVGGGAPLTWHCFAHPVCL